MPPPPQRPRPGAPAQPASADAARRAQRPTVPEPQPEREPDPQRTTRADTRRARATEQRLRYEPPPEHPVVAFLRGLMGVVGELLITCGVIILLFIVWQLWWTDVEADRDQGQTVSTLEDRFKDAKPVEVEAGTVPKLDPTNFKKGSFFAIVRVPRWGSDYARPVVQGTDHGDLSRGIGHTKDSAMPGEVGNFATAGHRTTYGKPYARIDELKPGDMLIVETKLGYYGYRYQRHKIVDPTQVEVQAPVPDKPGKKPTERWMTMVACHPPFSASKRYIGYAKLEAFVKRGDQVPAEWLTVEG